MREFRAEALSEGDHKNEGQLAGREVTIGCNRPLKVAGVARMGWLGLLLYSRPLPMKINDSERNGTNPPTG